MDMSFAFAARLALALMTMCAAAPVLAAGDPAAGQKVFNKCKTCHEADQAKNKVGPNLVGLFGRKAGSVADFKYSDAMKNSNVVWSETTVAEYVTKPKEFIPGNKMVFPGLKSDQEVADLIAYLKQATTPK
jgi:cytochrome c